MMREYQKNFITLYEDFRDSENRKNKAEKIKYILENLNIHNEKGVCLDIGCSNGIITESVSALFDRVIGLDFDSIAMKMVDQNSISSVKYVYGDAMCLPFPDQNFDALICSQTYEHVPSDVQLFSEILRVLKPGGIVYFSGPNKTFLIEPHYYLPFLHWLPEKWADCYVQLLGKGDKYYERSRTYWNLKKIFEPYKIIDVVIYVVEFYSLNNKKKLSRSLYKGLAHLPIFLWRLLSPFMININWILIKKENPDDEKTKVHFASTKSS
jgi:ubiquinone/menaquinone biosynthesis C-methylase UbiE